jgi:4-amino-4-deoxy-L-arabinose transferase-like glycosyltransferase
MTDEGWYGGAAIHHFLEGSWYLPDSFNPAVAMPVWPTMLGVWFALTGVSMVAARTLTMLLYGVSLVLLYRVVWRARPGRLAAVVVLLAAVNPFCYAFDRLALLEPVTAFWMMLALWIAGETRREDVLRQVLLGVVVVLLVLTKVTGIALVPAILYLMGARWKWTGLRRGLQWPGVVAVAVVAGTAAALWEGYRWLVIKPQHFADYAFLFKINAYRVHLSIVPRMAWVTLRDAGWINPLLLWAAVMIFVLSVVWLRELWRIPLFGSAAIAIVGHMAFIGYHTNFQPRYYLVIAMPLMVVIGLGVATMWDRYCPDRERLRLPVSGATFARWGAVVLAGVVFVAAVRMAAQTVGYVLHPEYTFWKAAQGIAAIMQADGGAQKKDARPVLLSDSGDDITLWTGVPAVCESLGVHGLDATLNRYKPEWYAAWPGWENQSIQQVGERYRLDEVARYRVFDDPTRQTLVLYRLTPR